MFLQIGCEIAPENIIERQVGALGLGCLAIFVALFMVLYLDYIKKIQENNYIEWDIKTITAGDYTIEFDIDPDFFDDFLVKEYTNWTAKQSDEKGIQYESRMAAFRDWI